MRTAAQQGWDRLRNGDLLTVAEGAGFGLLLTTDKNMRYQQNLAERKIAVIVLGHPQWPVLGFHVERVVAMVNAAMLGHPLHFTYSLTPPAAAVQKSQSLASGLCSPSQGWVDG